ncbi:MAG TPA: toxin-antitoxin system protein [Firmicutes bacterium]|nr:toxin-antitoxin system protein [Bacillota bacterium]HHY98538.1 toxin-antitoxin system protein [Bacillota bacterium]
MPGTTVRINYETWKALKELATRTGESMQSLLDKAIEEYRTKCFLEEANRAFAALKEDSEAWKAEIEERKAWDIASTDGLERW